MNYETFPFIHNTLEIEKHLTTLFFSCISNPLQLFSCYWQTVMFRDMHFFSI